MACRKATPGLLLTVALLLIGCSRLPGNDPFNQVYPKGHIAPTPLGPPILLPVSTCESGEFNHEVNIADLVTPLEEPEHLRGALRFSTTADNNPQLSGYTLQEQAFDEDLRGRVIDVYGKVDAEDGGVFWVES
jgi:hypothetical protein